MSQVTAEEGSARSRVHRRAVWVVTACGLVMLIVAGMLGWAAWRVHEAHRELEDEAIRIRELVRVSSLDEALTRLASSAALQRSAEWERRYHAARAELGAMTARAVQLAADRGAADAGRGLEASDARLRELEREALTIARAGEPGAALAVLATEEYHRHKERRAGALAEITSALQLRIEAELERFRARMVRSALLGMLGIVLAAAGWYRVASLVRRQAADRRRADRAAREGEERFRLVTDAIRDFGIMMLAPDGTILTWNRGAELTTGYDAEEAIGSRISWLYVPEDVKDDVPERDLEEAIAQGRAEREGWWLRRDGSRFWARQLVTPIHDVDGEVIGFASILQDLAGDREAEQRRRALAGEQAAPTAAELAERRITAILESITDIFATVDRAWRVVFVNSRAAEHLGRRREELLGQSLLALFPEHEAFLTGSGMRRALETQQPTTIELESRLKPGTWLEVHLYPTVDGISVYAKDVTQRRSVEQELRESEMRFRQLAEHMEEVVWLFAPDFSEALYVNPSYAKVFGRPGESLYTDPRSFLEAVHPDDRELVTTAMGDAREGAVAREFRIVWPDGEVRWVRASGFPVRNADGVVYRIAGITQDITERKRTDAAIRRARDGAERANRAKSEFLSRMSHELRTPMNAILGFGQLLEHSELEPDDRESAEQILKAGRHLLGLIDEVLDLSRIEAGRMTLSLETVPVREAVQRSVGLVRAIAAERGVTIVDGPGLECDRYVVADLQRLKQVLLNLLSNAIKYNRTGGSVTIRCEETAERTLRIAVQDTGFGIAPDELERLFTPFGRLGADRAGVEGSGIGLVLARGLVDMMGGTLGVESEPGVGSTFWAELPLATPPADLDEAVTGSAVAGAHPPAARTVLYIEDNLSNLRLVERILAQRPGIKLLVAMQGGLGLELARQHRPDLILLDLNLPDIPGAEVLERARQHPELRDTPAVVISADATPRQVERLLARGARMFLTKPLDVGQLLDAIDKTLEPDGIDAGK